MSQIARDAELDKEKLHKNGSISDNPKLATALKVNLTLGLIGHVAAINKAQMAF